MDPAVDEFTAVGIGDMSRRRVRQRDAAVATRSGSSPPTTTGTSSSTPTPDAAASFAERKRLFELAGSSWDDYDRELISEGGGV